MTTQPATASHTAPTGAQLSAAGHRILSALVFARAEGIQVLIGVEHHGVVCGSTHGEPRWERDPRQPGVDAIGACILEQQPHATDLEAATVEATGSSLPYVEGFMVGMEKTSPASRARRAAEIRWWLSGVEDGGIVRMWLAGRLPAALVTGGR